MTIDTKLELVRQVKEQYAKDQNDLSKREQILYGTCSRREDARGYTVETPSEEETSSGSSLKLRFMLAVILFAAFVFMEQSSGSLAGITTEQIYQTLASNQLFVNP